MRRRSRTGLGAFMLLLGVGWALRGPAVADDASDRAGYLNEIGTNLNDAASRLSSAASASDDGYLRTAENHIDKVRELVGRLNDKKGDDARAKDVVDRYPRYVTELQSAARELRTLKARQQAVGDLVRQCKAFDVSMVERAKAAKDEPKGAEELSDFAKSVGRKAEDLMRDAERTKSEVERSASDVRRFSPGDGWSAVKDAAHRAADDMSRSWVSTWEQARRDCEEVLKRERHREVERVLGQLSSSRTGRAELRRNIDAMLDLIATRLKDVATDSSSSNANGAVEITKQLESLLDRLQRAQGDDPESKTIASTWPSWTRELRTSVEALRELKDWQYRVDTGGDKCTAAERDLQIAIRTWVGDPTKNREGLAQLPGRMRQLGNEWKPKMEAAQQGDRAVATLHATAKRFTRSDGPWSPITQRLHDSADAIHKHWRDKYAAATAACTNLALGEAHPDAQKAMTEMQRSTADAATSYRELRVEFNRWKTDVDQLRDWSAKDVAEIREAFCKAPDTETYEDLEEAMAVANRWSSKLQALWGSINGQGDRIKARANELISKGRALKNGPKAIKGVDDIQKSIEKLKDHQLFGSNDPLFKAFADYGVQEHNRRQGKCGANREIPIKDYCENPNPKRKDCKMDCVLVSDKVCTIVEIKPKSAQRLGDDQAGAYEDAIRKLFAARGPSGFTDKLSVFRNCISDDGKSINLKRAVETYDFCNRSEPLGAQLPEVRVELPEDEE
ncbi:MAG: hypothetical protein KF773_35835 [Deltaproteobacteria bacterium]|nr:hypothetical protein [Deltaproteobacteria bacterium]